VFSLLAHSQPTSKFGEVFQYSNMMAAGAGYVGAHIAYPDLELGAAYDKAMQIKMPETREGIVILTNADVGGMINGALSRRLLEILFDGKPEAEGNLAASAANYKAAVAKERTRLVVPADPAIVSKLAAHYSSKELGNIDVRSANAATVCDFGDWKSAVASRKNDDGTISLVTIDPTNDGFEFVVGEKAGKRILTVRDAQHEYVFSE
jgi:hypothetical protein